MDDKYIEQKMKEIEVFCDSGSNYEQRKKFLRLILEAVWLSGKCEGIQEAREVLNG